MRRVLPAPAVQQERTMRTGACVIALDQIHAKTPVADDDDDDDDDEEAEAGAGAGTGTGAATCHDNKSGKAINDKDASS